MASITFTVASTSINGSKSFTLTDAEIARFVAAWKINRLNPSASTVQTLLDWAQYNMDNATSVTLAYERQQLAAGAAPLNPS